MCLVLLLMVVSVVALNHRAGGTQSVESGSNTTLSLPDLNAPSTDGSPSGSPVPSSDPLATTDPILLPSDTAPTATTHPGGGTAPGGATVPAGGDSTTPTPPETTQPKPTTTTTRPNPPACQAAHEAQYRAQILGNAGQFGRYSEIRTDAAILAAALKRLAELTVGAIHDYATQLQAAVNKAIETNVATPDAQLGAVYQALQKSYLTLATNLFGPLQAICPGMNGVSAG